MKLVIAEKQSVAKAIQSAIGNQYTVVALRGHIYEQASPDEYLPDDVPLNGKGNKEWRKKDLPIIPQEWHRNLKPRCEDILDKVADHLDAATEVIHAGDADREGQLLVDEVLEELGYTGPVKRVWLKSLTPAAIQKAFQSLRPNCEYRPLSQSALARSRADWLVGFNLSRAYALNFRANNIQLGKISIGRVQTPALAMIVKRDLEIESFKPHRYYEIHAHVQHPHVKGHNGVIPLEWIPSKPSGRCFDEAGRLTSYTLANSILASAHGAGVVTEYREEKFERDSPLPFNLSGLQMMASQKYGMSAMDVLNACQSLYEAGAITYPRTHCQYIPRQEMSRLQAIALNFNSVQQIPSCDVHQAFDDNLVSAHTAILPTEVIPQNLSGHEQHVYELIRKYAAALYLPPAKEVHETATIKLGRETWRFALTWTANMGWTELFPDEVGDYYPCPYQGDRVEFIHAKLDEYETKPPERYTDGSLIDDMVNIDRHVNDAMHKATLQDSGGIGTEATRAVIIENLIENKLVMRDGQCLISTAKGRALIESIPEALCDPVMTAQWEQKLSKIVDGNLDIDTFVAEVTGFVSAQVAKAFQK